MNIKEYWARLVDSGLAPDWDNVVAHWYRESEAWGLDNNKSGGRVLSTIPSLEHPKDQEYKNCVIQLRKDGKDLYELEWRKPTEEDVGKMCWFYNEIGMDNIPEISLTKLDDIEEDIDEENENCCLLADHGQIAPTPEDFIKVFGGK